ncbi:hypothetical protein PISL3812_02982 [Talaromyces islandicus]|uniref:LEA domain protein n=1 Tax=Talaromyces islandicus TaxID=28573 RepID=A0A0U1LRG3_TALIS|nr:hypothetical protein PISL3812_02982 [Talaromyces islandicus]
MSFLTRTVPLTTARATGVIIAPSSVLAYRSISTTPVAQRGPVEATKDTIKKVDRTVANAAVKGIETGEKVTKKTQETIGLKGHEAEGKANEIAGEAKGKASELEGRAKGKAEELRHQMKP